MIICDAPALITPASVRRKRTDYCSSTLRSVIWCTVRGVAWEIINMHAVYGIWCLERRHSHLCTAVCYDLLSCSTMWWFVKWCTVFLCSVVMFIWGTTQRFTLWRSSTVVTLVVPKCMEVTLWFIVSAPAMSNALYIEMLKYSCLHRCLWCWFHVVHDGLGARGWKRFADIDATTQLIHGVVGLNLNGDWLMDTSCMADMMILVDNDRDFTWQRRHWWIGVQLLMFSKIYCSLRWKSLETGSSMDVDCCSFQFNSWRVGYL